MKKILTLFAVIGMMAFSSCSNNDDVDNDTISEVYEVSNVNFTSANSYNPIITLNPAIFGSDMVLVYRLAGSENGRDVWRLLPENYFLANGTLDFGFDYDFTTNDVSIFMVGSNLGGVVDSFRTNQVFRIVIIPGFVTTAKSANKADFSDYDSVIQRYNIDDSKIKKIRL